MSRPQIAKIILFPLMVLGLFLVGWLIPAFYDWSGVNQSYSTPQFDQAMWTLISCVVLAWIAIPWLPMKRVELEEPDKKRFQFDLRLLLLMTTGVAIAIAGMINLPSIFVISAGIVVFVLATRIVLLFLSNRWQLALLVACMYLPFAWVVSGDSFKDVSSQLLFGAFGLPAFLPALFLGSLFIKNVQNAYWLFLLLTSIELAMGCWTMKLGPKRMLAYLLFVLMASVYGSVVLQALMRM